MKKFAVIMICLLFLGCNFTFLNTSPGKDICLQKPPEAKSWLCEAAAKAGVTLDSVNDLLLDASAATVLIADIDIKRIGNFLNKVESYLNMASIEKLTYTMLINRLEMDSQKAEILKNMLSRRLQYFHSNELISAWDLYLLKLAVETHKEQFGLT